MIRSICAAVLLAMPIHAQTVLWAATMPESQLLGDLGRGDDPLQDFDRDGVLDVLTFAVTSINTGTPFATLIAGVDGQVLGTRLGLTHVTASPDVNGDGVPDVWGLLRESQGYSYALVSGASVLAAASSPPLAAFARPGDDVITTSDDLLGSGFDATNDGVPDLLALHSGRVWVHSGAALAGGDITPTRSFMPPPADAAGAASFATSRHSNIALIPDLDGDGLADLLVSDPDFDEGGAPQFDFGVVYAFSGGTGALIHRLRAPDAPFGARLFGSTALAVIGGATGPGAGSDLTGDGVPDIAIGSGTFDSSLDGVIDLFDGATGDHIRWIVAMDAIDSANFARQMRLIPDTDGDGIADLVVSLFVDDGRPGGPSSAVAAFSTGTGDEVWRVVEPVVGSGFGGGFLGSAGDLDGDGQADLFVGTPFLDVNGQQFAGGVYAISAPAPVASESPTGSAALRLAASPNPSRGAPTLAFTLAETAHVRLLVLDALGREVAVLMDGVRSAGPHRVEVSRTLAPGVYVARLAVDGAVTIRTMSVVR